MDPLSQVLMLIKPHAVLVKQAIEDGETISYPPSNEPSFVLMLAGACRVAHANDKIETLLSGDFRLFPETPGLTLRNLEDLPRKQDTIESLSGGSNPDLFSDDVADRQSPVVLSGWLSFDAANLPLAKEIVSHPVRIGDDCQASDCFLQIVSLIRREASDGRSGTDLILQRLVEVLLVESLRLSHNHHGRGSIISGLLDTRLTDILGLIQAEPEHSWTVEEMARVAGMPLLTFIERFSLSVGKAPLDYLRTWRMAVAKHLMANERRRPIDVATMVGYASEGMFNEEFDSETGRQPDEFYRQSML